MRLSCNVSEVLSRAYALWDVTSNDLWMQ